MFFFLDTQYIFQLLVLSDNDDEELPKKYFQLNALNCFKNMSFY